MVKILLTGASGLLGRHLLPLLLEEHAVFSVGKSRIPLTERMPLIDLAQSLNADALPKKIDVVIHLAQSPRYREFPQGATDVFNVNVASTAQLLEYARVAEAKRFILASTGGIYRAGGSPVSEDSETLGPAELGHYFATKLSSEMLAGNYRKFMEVHILRIFFMFGPGQRREMFIPSLIDRIARGESVQLNGRNGIRINPVHAKDAARALQVLTLHGGPKTVNIAGEQVVTIREISDEIGRCLNVKPSFERFSAAKDLVADTRVLTTLIGPNQQNVLSSMQDLVSEYSRKNR